MGSGNEDLWTLCPKEFSLKLAPGSCEGELRAEKGREGKQ